jgi:hypothetical protein
VSTEGRTIFFRYGKLTRTVPVQLWPALYFGRLGSQRSRIIWHHMGHITQCGKDI